MIQLYYNVTQLTLTGLGEDPKVGATPEIDAADRRMPPASTRAVMTLVFGCACYLSCRLVLT